MPSLKKISILFISILLTLLQGCGSGSSDVSTTPYATTLGDGVSIGTTDKDAIMSPNINVVKSIAQEVSTILKTNLATYNEKDALDFSKATNYCDISGLKDTIHSATMEKVSSEQNYLECQEEQNLQHGKITIEYQHMDEEGKYPKTMALSISEDYTFNTITLKNNLTVQSTILYNAERSIQQIHIKINGNLNYDNINYHLQNISQTIAY